MHPLLPPSLLSVEPPEHTRYRKLVSSVFTPRAVAALRDRVQTTANDVLDGLHDDGGGVDVVQRYCSRLPVAVISDILGVPEQERPRVLEFGELAAPSLDLGLSWQQYKRVQEGLAGFNTWLTDHLQQLRSNPGDDLMSQLIQASDEGARLDNRELVATAGLVLAAGFETTVNLSGNGIRLLIDRPDNVETLTARARSCGPTPSRKSLQLDPPVQMTARVALVDTEVAGTQIRAGETIIIHVVGANRDPKMFDDPHRLDIERPNAGQAPVLLGRSAFLPRRRAGPREGEVGLRTFFDRFPNAQLAGEGSRPNAGYCAARSSLPSRSGKRVPAVSS